MKRLAAILFVFISLISLAACNAENAEEIIEERIEENEERIEGASKEALEESEKNHTEKDYSDSVIQQFVNVSKLSDKTVSNITDILIGDSMTLDAEAKIAVTSGISIDFTVYIVKNGDDLYQKYTVAGQSVTVINKSDGIYAVHDDTKTVDFSPKNSSTEEYSEIESIVNTIATQITSYVMSGFGFDTIEYSNSGSEEYKGTVYDFEEYASERANIKIYYSGNSPKHIVSRDGSGNISVITVNSLTAEYDPSIFSIPEDYEINE